MEASLFFEQLLNGVQLGVMLFLMAAGLTLIFGIMNFLNLAHGALYMLGAFFAATALEWTGSFLLAIVLGVAASATLGIILDVVVFRPLYERSHFDQVLGTFALILFFNDLVVLLWGPEPRYMAIPDWLSGSVSLSGEVSYPIYRLLIMGAGLTVAAALYALITHTRTGMLIRAGASNREMLSGLGTNVRGLSMFVFALGSAMAGFAGMITGPLIAVQVGMGDVMLIVSFLVIVIGGLGSIAGAFVAAIIVGIVDTLGRFLLPQWLGYTAGPALASMASYALMAAVLFVRPQGLLGSRRG
ncbi:MAG: branched-chain amino acid ABC transporter permease [Xanthobacteraceae bacterium]|jgi:branched-chain amino acid transport system permease protein